MVTAELARDITVLQVARVAKRYGRHEVLRDVSFEMQQGELVGITGENGAGKSTLLNILVGLLAPSEGLVALRGRVGYCPQELMVHETLTVEDNMVYFACAYGLRPGNADSPYMARRTELLERFGFASYQDTLVRHLSGGTKQKLNLCLSLLHAPDLLILDEPYAGFDWETYLHFWEYAEELQTDGRSVLIVSHLVYDRGRFDRLYELEDGGLRCVDAS